MVIFLNPLFNLIRAMAFLPIRVVKIPNGNKIDFRFSKVLILSSIFLGILVAYSVYAQNLQDNSIDIRHDYFQFSPTLILTGSCLNYVMHLLPLFCFLQVGKKMKVFKEISDLVLFLHKGTLTVEKRCIISYSTLIYACYSIGAFIYSFRDAYVMKVMYVNKYLELVLTCAVIEFFEVVSDVKDCFYQVNVAIPKTFERCFSRETLRYSVPSVEVSRVAQTADLDLRDLLELHRHLCCIVEKVNAVYGCQNLIAVVFIFLHLIFTPLMMLSLPYKYHTWPILLHGINGFLMFIVLLYTLVRPCSQAAAEAKRTVAIVSKLMGRSVREDLFKELEMYCRQLFLRKVEFSACGFFTLEIPLILSMLSIVTTYFTIILQLQMTDSKNGMSTTETIPQHNFTLIP